MIEKLFTCRRSYPCLILGGIGNIIYLIVLGFLIYYNILSPTLALAYLPLIFAAFFGGLLSGMVSAILLSISAVIVLGYDSSRTIQVIVIGFVIAIVLGYSREREIAAKRKEADALSTLRFIKSINAEPKKVEAIIAQLLLFDTLIDAGESKALHLAVYHLHGELRNLATLLTLSDEQDTNEV